jgi:hypothetical protein
LAQQIAGEVAAQEWEEPVLLALCRRAWPYRDPRRTASGGPRRPEDLNREPIPHTWSYKIDKAA